MNIAIIHHHLNRGGVTQVVLNHLRSLSEVADQFGPCRAAVLFGGRKEDWPSDLPNRLPGVTLTLHTLPDLEYDSDADARPRPESLAKQLSDTLRAIGFGPSNALLHVHNHALGKNLSLPGALNCLARDGYPMVLQVHDFAEDFRPENYRRLSAMLGGDDQEKFCGTLYPQAPQIHYAVLNGRDRKVLRSAGIFKSALHDLPNPVAGFGQLPPREEAKSKLRGRLGTAAGGRLVLYPVRGIRRKNVGELLLCAAAAEPDTVFGITQPPLNPLERPRYESWKRLASNLTLPCLFELGRLSGVTFADNMAAADAIITSSVAEGFGMVFLEAWLARRILVGRDLPEISADFLQAGVQLPTLYNRLAIPLSWVEKEAFFDSMLAAYGQVLAAFGRPMPPAGKINGELESLITDGNVDFAYLDSELQGGVIRRVREDAAKRDALLDLNPRLAGYLDESGEGTRRLIDANQYAVRQAFSLQSAGQQLHKLYRAALESPRSDRVEPPASGENILASFLSLSRLHPLRIER
jgi:glycosyltransferase involved in cell wall biosynthesis